MAVGFSGGDQTHDRGGAFAGGLRSSKKPIFTAKGDRPDGILNGVVVDRMAAVVEIAA